MNNPTAAVNILLVEDSPTDVLMTRAALESGGYNIKLHVVADGVQAMAFLRRDAAFPGAVRPDVVLLDLNLPRKDGREVLAEMKADDALKSIPVVVLTTSREDDINRSYALHANSFIAKPVDYVNFEKVMDAVKHYWIRTASLPVREAV